VTERPIALPPHSNEGSSAMPKQRRRFKQTQTLEQRLLDRVNSLREEAKPMRPCFEREALLRKARQAETAAHIDEWLRSPGLQPPK
jgi:hypothetical protein